MHIHRKKSDRIYFQKRFVVSVKNRNDQQHKPFSHHSSTKSFFTQSIDKTGKEGKTYEESNIHPCFVAHISFRFKRRSSIDTYYIDQRVSEMESLYT
jgi:hypothetical protein